MFLQPKQNKIIASQMNVKGVQNMRARLICNESKYCHITPVLVDLYLLPVKFRI